jgi:hypothetical protein
MIRHTIKLWLPVTVLVFFPAVAYADAGTPLMWASAFHLVLGNAIIGIAEGMILALLFRQRRASCVAIMIAANYFSAWAGGVFLIPTITASVSLDLYNAWRWLWYMVVISYFVTLLLEWPFVALCLRKSDGWFRKSIWGSLVVQSASYLVLFGWYWAASGTSLYSGLTVVQPSAISLPQGAMLYYIAENGTDVYAYDLAQAKAGKICDLKSPGREDRLVLQKSRTAAGRWDVIAGPVGNTEPRHSSPSDRIVSAGLECDTAEPPSVGFSPGGEVPRFRADKSGWQFDFGWMADGLHGRNAVEGQKLDVSLETPFLYWYIGYPTQLPSGQVVFQLGWNQICILDPNERKVALLAKGRWPVITMTNRPK